MNNIKLLTWEAFQTMLANLLDLNQEQVTPEAYFIVDLGVDSIRLVEVLLKLEKLGVEISPDLAWQIETVEDAYRYYQKHAGDR